MNVNEKVFVVMEGVIEKIERCNNFNHDGGHEVFYTVRGECGPAGSSYAIVDAKKINQINQKGA